MTRATNLQNLAQQRWDALVIGAGPAGAIAAHDLARRGRTVLLVERSRFPRYKVCGGCLNLRAIGALAESGLEEKVWKSGALSLDVFSLSANRRRANIPLPGGASISREVLDQTLVNAATASGAGFIEGIRATTESLNDGVVHVRLASNDDSAVVEARSCIVAGGLSSDTLKHVDDIRTKISPNARLGAGTLLECAEDVYAPGTIHMAVARHGYVGLVRVENNRLNVAAAFDTKFLRERGSPAAAAIAILDDSGLQCPEGLDTVTWRGTPPLTRTSRPTALHRLLLVGDSAGYIEPFTGEGMAWALESGRNAAALVHRSLEDWSAETSAQWHADYARRFASAQRRCHIIAAGLRTPLVTTVAIRALHTAPALARPFVNAFNARSSNREYAP